MDFFQRYSVAGTPIGDRILGFVTALEMTPDKFGGIYVANTYSNSLMYVDSQGNVNSTSVVISNISDAQSVFFTAVALDAFGNLWLGLDYGRGSGTSLYKVGSAADGVTSSTENTGSTPVTSSTRKFKLIPDL